jgi:phosphoglycerate dehydrogenase-like enzyme
VAPLRILSHLGGDTPERIRALAPDAEVVRVRGSGAVPEGLDGDVLVTLETRHLPNLPEVLASATSLRWVHVATTGVDQFPLDLVPPDVVVTCNRGASATPISEWVLATLLAFEKRFPEIWLSEAPEAWNFADVGSLEDRNVGIVGWGAIAHAVARRTLPFGSHVRAYRRRPEPSDLDGVEIVGSVAELAAWADHLVVAAASTPETRHIVGAELLAAAKPGLHLVNIARGALVDQDALRVGLDDGTVARATLDVCEPEPLPAGHWLYEHPKVRLSAHVSWTTPKAMDGLVDPFLANLGHWLADEPLDGEVDRAAGY